MSEVYRTQGAARSRSTTAHWHWPAPRIQWRPIPGSACGDRRLAHETARDPAGVPVEARCRARGCRERWTAVEQGPDLMTVTTEGTT